MSSWERALEIADEGGLISDAIESIVEMFKDAGQRVEDDLRRLATGIANDMVRAQLQGRDDLVRELEGQTKMLIEMQRLRAVGLAEEAVRTAIRTATALAARIAARIATGGMIG